MLALRRLIIQRTLNEVDGENCASLSIVDE
jgi:hypothetical protein